MNLAKGGLMLVIAPHKLGVCERAYLNASPWNSGSSTAFLAPPARRSPKVLLVFQLFAGSIPIDSGASSQGWLTMKPPANQNHRPARRTFPSCTHRADLLATKYVTPRGLARADERRTPQVIAAPALFGKPRGEVSTARLRTGLRPVDAPFHETSVTGLRPVGQDCSAATLGPAANAAPSSSALDSLGNARALLPRPPRRRARRRRQAAARRCSLALHRSRLPPMPSRRMAPRNPMRRPEPSARAANLPQLHSPRGPFRLPTPARSSSTFPAMPSLFPLDKLPRRRDHRFTNTPRGTHGGNTSCHRRPGTLERIALLAPSSLPARDLRQKPWLLPNKGLHPTRFAGG
jgi:hypothetical protein